MQKWGEAGSQNGSKRGEHRVPASSQKKKGLVTLELQDLSLELGRGRLQSWQYPLGQVTLEPSASMSPSGKQEEGKNLFPWAVGVK